MNNLFTILMFSVLAVSLSAQQKTTYKVVPIVAKESFYLNGGARAAFGGKSRNYIQISLPRNTVEWYYAISTTATEKQEAPIGLASQLMKMLIPGVGMPATVLTAIMAPTGAAVCDAYVIADVNSLNRFLSKNGAFSYVMSGSREQIRQGVVQIRDELSGPYYLSLRNPSGMAGLNVTIEVAAVVKETE